MISYVDKENLEYVWSAVRPQILKALSHGAGDATTEAHLYQMILKDLAQAWVVHEGDEVIALLIVSVKEHPNKKTVFVEVCAGKDLSSWLPEAEESLRKYRDFLQADTIEMCCRKGLTTLPNWRVKAYLMELL